MKIVIDIPEDVYEEIKSGDWDDLALVFYIIKVSGKWDAFARTIQGGERMTDEEINNEVMSFQQIIIDSQSKDIQEISRDYVKLQEKYIKLRKAVVKIKEEMAENGNSDINTQTVLFVIDKHLKEVENNE